MTVKDLIKLYDFYEVVGKLAKQKAKKEKRPLLTAVYREDYEDAVLEILTIRPVNLGGFVQNIKTPFGYQNFYVEEALWRNCSLVAVPWENVAGADVRLESSEGGKVVPTMESALSILNDMTLLACSSEKVKKILEEL